MANEEVVEEVKDPQGLLVAYNKLKEDLKNLRAENTQLSTDLEGARDAIKSPDEWKERALNSEVKLALTAQGIKDTDRLMKFVGTEGLSFDADNKLTGLDERMKQLKTELPEVFDAKRRVGGKADAFSDAPAQAKIDPFRSAVHTALNG